MPLNFAGWMAFSRRKYMRRLRQQYWLRKFRTVHDGSPVKGFLLGHPACGGIAKGGQNTNAPWLDREPVNAHQPVSKSLIGQVT